jgi:hypothetical protein
VFVFETPGNYFGRFSNLFQLNSNLKLNFGQVHLPLPILFSLPSVSFPCKPTKGEEVDLLEIFLSGAKDIENLLLFVLFHLASREEGSPRLTLPKNPLPLLFFDHPAAIDPQCEDAALLTPQTRPQLAGTWHKHPMPPWNVTMATVGIPAWTSRHRPPPELSPHR